MKFSHEKVTTFLLKLVDKIFQLVGKKWLNVVLVTKIFADLHTDLTFLWPIFLPIT